jgi:hypothetical protein
MLGVQSTAWYSRNQQRPSPALIGVNWTNNTTNLHTTSWGYHDITSLVWNGSSWAAVGSPSAVSNVNRFATSPDGINWTYNNGLNSAWTDRSSIGQMIWNGSQYTVVGSVSGSRGISAVSSNGSSWTLSTTLSQTMRSVAWNGSIYCAGGNSGSVWTSTNGITWTFQSSLINGTWATMAVSVMVWTGSQFAIVNGSRFATSTNGITWTYRSSMGSAAAGASMSTLAGTNNLLLAGGENATLLRSVDGGVTWTKLGTSFTNAWGSTTSWVRFITWTGSSFVAVGDGRVAASTDGQTWTAGSLNNAFGTGRPQALAWNGNTLGALGQTNSTIVFAQTV